MTVPVLTAKENALKALGSISIEELKVMSDQTFTAIEAIYDKFLYEGGKIEQIKELAKYLIDRLEIDRLENKLKTP